MYNCTRGYRGFKRNHYYHHYPQANTCAHKCRERDEFRMCLVLRDSGRGHLPSLTVMMGISLSDFYFLNPEVNSPNCTNLLTGYAYCVQAVGDISTYPGYESVLPHFIPEDPKAQGLY
ncbi:hypothetical protein BDV12DRAFT_192829 [Aspergillus spectabilis]